MENHRLITAIVLLIVIVVGAYWLSYTPSGSVVRGNALVANPLAAGYVTTAPVYGTTTATYPAYTAPTSYPAATAYVTYPIAKSTSSSSSIYPGQTSYYSTSSYPTYPTPNYYPTSYPAGGCYVSGCSAQICSDNPSAVSTCEYRPQYACYLATSRCERQLGGQCGWTPTNELYSCLSNNP